LHPYYREVRGEYLVRSVLPPAVMIATCVARSFSGLRVALGRSGDVVDRAAGAAPPGLHDDPGLQRSPAAGEPFGMVTKNLPLLAVIGKRVAGGTARAGARGAAGCSARYGANSGITEASFQSSFFQRKRN